MNLVFELWMPSNNSSNGRWTGDAGYYARVRNFRSKKALIRANEILEKKYFMYSFGDGWVARIDVYEASNNKSRQVRKKSNGFCGYDWMIDSIVKNLKIEPMASE